MRRVFPRGTLKLLCQRCAKKGKETPAGIQSNSKAFCFPCYQEYKEEIAEHFNTMLGGTVVIIDDDDEEGECQCH
jgi:hypothetical protein